MGAHISPAELLNSLVTGGVLREYVDGWWIENYGMEKWVPYREVAALKREGKLAYGFEQHGYVISELWQKAHP